MDTTMQKDHLTRYRTNDICEPMAKTMEQTIRRAFQESGMSIKKLAEKTDTPYAAAHKFLTGGGSATLTTANKFCKELGLELTKKRRRTRGKSK